MLNVSYKNLRTFKEVLNTYALRIRTDLTIVYKFKTMYSTPRLQCGHYTHYTRSRICCCRDHSLQLLCAGEFQIVILRAFRHTLKSSLWLISLQYGYWPHSSANIQSLILKIIYSPYGQRAWVEFIDYPRVSERARVWVCDIVQVRVCNSAGTLTSLFIHHVAS